MPSPVTFFCGGVTHHTAVGPGLARRRGALSGLGWHYLGAQHLPRQAHEILVEDHVREALIRLNPEIAAQPDRADDVLFTGLVNLTVSVDDISHSPPACSTARMDSVSSSPLT